jgi:hypothetical protein
MQARIMFATVRQVASRRLPLGAMCVAIVVAACGGGTVGSSHEPTEAAPPPSVERASNPPGSVSPAEAPASSGPSVTGGIDACSLLPDKEVLAATGHAIAKADSWQKFVSDTSGCRLTLEQGDQVVTPSIEVGVYAPGGRTYYDTFFKRFAAEYGHSPMPGLGDEAVEDDIGVLLLVEGDAFLTLQYLAEPADAPAARALAEAAVARLP